MHYRQLKPGMKVSILNNLTGFILIATFSGFAKAPTFKMGSVDTMVFKLEDGSKYTMFLAEASEWYTIDKVSV